MKRLGVAVVVLFLGVILGSLVGCRIFGLSDLGEQVESLQAPTGNAKVAFRLVLPDGSGPSANPALLAGARAAKVTFRLVLVNPGNPTTPTTTMTKTVEAVEGVAQTLFAGVPAQAAVGEIQIASGTIGGKTDFHGAADLLDGSNVMDVSPKGSNLRADVLAQVVLSIANDPSLMAKAPKLLTTAIENAGASLLAAPTSAVYSDVLNATVVSSFDPTAFVKMVKSVDETTLSGNGSTTWSITGSSVWTSGVLAGVAKVGRVLRQGFGGFGYVSWYGGARGGVTKLQTGNGAVLARLTSEGSFEQFVILPNNELLIGGTLGGQPMLCRWDASADAAVTATMQTGAQSGSLKWIQRFDARGTHVDVPNPAVEFLPFDGVGGGRVTCTIRDPQTRSPLLCEVNPDTGAATYVNTTPAMWSNRGWVERMRCAGRSAPPMAFPRAHIWGSSG